MTWVLLLLLLLLPQLLEIQLSTSLIREGVPNNLIKGFRIIAADEINYFYCIN